MKNPADLAQPSAMSQAGVRDTAKPRPKKKLPRTVPRDEVAAIRESFSAADLRNPTHLRDCCIFEMWLRAGLRIGELRRLQVRDIDLVAGEIAVWDSKTGDGTAYFNTAQLSPLLERWLDVRRRELRRKLGKVPRDAPMFCVLRDDPPRSIPGTELNERTVQQMVKRRAKKAGVDPSKVTPHRFRHTFATTMLSKRGVTVYDVQKYMRHRSLKSTEEYLHVTDIALREKMQQVDL